MIPSAMPISPIAPVAAAPAPFDPFQGGEIDRVYKSSEAQREVWLADRMGTAASLAFNESICLHLAGPLDAPALARALDALLDRHEALRGTFSADGTDFLIGARNGPTGGIEYLRALSAQRRADALSNACNESVRRPFDLERGPLFHSAIFRIADDAHVVLMSAHHIVCDGWSWSVIGEDLGRLYAEQVGQAPTPEAALAYSDFVEWQEQAAATGTSQAHGRFWSERFAGTSLPVLRLPNDRRRPAVRQFESRRADHLLGRSLVDALRKVAGQSNASLFATLYTGFACLLARITGQDDLVIGVPAAGQSASGLGRLVGHCVHLLPVRTAIDSSRPFAETLAQTATTLLDAFDHQSVTYGSLLRNLTLPRDPSRLPLVSVMFNLDPSSDSVSDAFPGLSVTVSGNARCFENFELFVNAVVCPEGVRLEVQYSTALFEGATVERWLRLLETILASVVADPRTPVERLTWVDAHELQALRAFQPAATWLPPDSLMQSSFERQCAMTPERIALVHGSDSLTYRALDERSNRLAHALRKRGMGRGQRVGICLPRGLDMVVALLASLKAGASYVPLDPGFPVQRLEFYARDAGLGLLVTEAALAAAPHEWRTDAAVRLLFLDADTAWLIEPATALPPGCLDATPRDAAYVIYTSGSTGTPKGVEVPHGAVANFLQSMRKTPGIGPDDRLAAVTTLSFDIAVLELMLPLCVGARTLLVPREQAMDAQLLSDALSRSGATMMQATPGLWRMLVESGWRPAAGFRALIGGESLPGDLATDLCGRAAEVWNLYGPTETTVWSTVWKVEPTSLQEHGVSIGRPIDNTVAWVVDPFGEPCPIGVPGELCLGGAGVANGYVGRPDLTADRFVPDRLSTVDAARTAARMYRTGDLVRWRNDGSLVHLGRLDNQVKLRGYRVELGEIETACEAVGGIKRCVVTTHEAGPGDVRLVAYLSVDEPLRTDWSSTLRQALGRTLPDYMLPQHVVLIDEWPLLPNGKLDRSRLPAPGNPRPVGKTVARTAARTSHERAVAAAMEALLHLPALDVGDDFFVLGGHSLLAARLVSRLNKELGIRLPLRSVFESPTIESLAAAIGDLKRSELSDRPAIDFMPQRREAVLTLSQERVRFVEEMHPGRATYNMPSGHRLKGPLLLPLFEAALGCVVERQPALRTQIEVVIGGNGYAQTVAEASPVRLELIDLTGLPAAEREPEMLRRMHASIEIPIALDRAPLFRVALYRLADDDHGFLFMPHHVVFDGWSFDVFYDEIAAAYGALLRGVPNVLPPLQASYGDFAQWQQQWVRSAEYEVQRRYWRDRLAHRPPPRAMQPDFARRAGRSGSGGAELIRIDPASTLQLRKLAAECDATMNMILMAVYAALMGSLVEDGSISLGIPVAGRLVPEFESVIGYFGNLLPVSIEVRSNESFVQFVQRVKADLLEVLSNQEVPFEQLGSDSEGTPGPRDVGLYQALFSFQDARGRQRVWGDLEHQTIVLFQPGATEDIGAWLMELPDRIEGGLIYNADLYRRETALAVRDKFLAMLQRVVEDRNVTVGQLLTSSVCSADDRLSGRLRTGATDAARVSVPSDTRVDQPPLSPAEHALARIWAELLRIDAEHIHAEDGFFDLGGDSLLAMRAVHQTARQLGTTVEPRRYLFESLAQLAATAGTAPTAQEHVDTSVNATPGPFRRVLAALKRRQG